MSEVELQSLDTPLEETSIPAQGSETSTDGVENGVTEGVENPAFTSFVEPGPDEAPPMTYVDFTPLLLEEAASHADAPRYAAFNTVLEQANQWLKGNIEFQAMKVESMIKKLGDKDHLDHEQVIHHESSHGINKYVRCLRLWLAPKEDPDTPPQEISYVTTIPDPSDGTASTAEQAMALLTPGMFKVSVTMPAYTGMAEMMEKLNKFLKKKPLPGSVLNIETIKTKYEEDGSSKCVDTERMSWVDCGKADRVYIYALRVFYLVGKPAFEVIGMHDEEPVCQNNWEMTSKLRFCPFTTVVQRAKTWLQKQKGVRVVNMQTMDVFCDRGREGETKIHSDKAGHGEPANIDTQFARVLRLYYVIDNKSDVCPYESLGLTTRLFIPARRGQYGKVCESFSKTMQRITKWLQLTKTPIFGIETVIHPFSTDAYGSGIKEDSACLSYVAAMGKYYITTVRVYFPCEFKEPPPELLPQIEEEEGWWACTLS